MLIDARGKDCPLPVTMTDDALSTVNQGLVEVLVDNEDAARNIAGYAAQNGLFAETAREGGVWKVRVVKGYACKPAGESALAAPAGEAAGATQRNAKAMQKTLMLIVGTDCLGKEEELGKKLVKGFFDTMKVHKQIPHTLFFLNAGVKLTTINSETVAVLKELENLGAEIYSCGTCLMHYNLESALKVGKRGATNQIVEGMQDFDKVVWI